MPTQYKFIKHTLYQLRQSYGVDVNLYRQQTYAVDYATGVKTPNRVKYVIRKAIRLPRRGIRNAEGDFATFLKYVSFDKNVRQFIFGESFKPDIDDILIVGGERLNVKEVLEIEYGLGYHVICEHMEGSQANIIHTINMTLTLSPEETIGGSK